MTAAQTVVTPHPLAGHPRALSPPRSSPELWVLLAHAATPRGCPIAAASSRTRSRSDTEEASSFIFPPTHDTKGSIPICSAAHPLPPARAQLLLKPPDLSRRVTFEPPFRCMSGLILSPLAPLRTPRARFIPLRSAGTSPVDAIRASPFSRFRRRIHLTLPSFDGLPQTRRCKSLQS